MDEIIPAVPSDIMFRVEHRGLTGILQTRPYPGHAWPVQTLVEVLAFSGVKVTEVKVLVRVIKPGSAIHNVKGWVDWSLVHEVA
jgi:hypothetical protein